MNFKIFKIRLRVKADDPKSDSEGWDSEDDDGFSSNYETDDGDRDEGEISEDVWHSELETVPLKIRGKALHVEESGNLTPAPGRTAVNNSGSSAGSVESTSFEPKRPSGVLQALGLLRLGHHGEDRRRKRRRKTK